MKKFSPLLIIIILALVLSIGYFVTKKTGTQKATETSATPSTSQTYQNLPTQKPIDSTNHSAFCDLHDIKAEILLEGAAGNIYGTLRLTNTSGKLCQIQGNKFVQATSSAKNIIITKQGSPGPAILPLATSQTTYSKVHYPNGPQCSNGIKQATITFTYPISPNNSVVFKNAAGETKQNITVCTDPSEKTEVQVWSILTN